ncbi:Na/Pi cotransporter family protein [Hydrogenovibrio sp. 3SP14C1]|uniref:Na/Pi cotransporter family protein n=1 Tax=Hydrogenovibrio sp. 3SP14C1 TaxID=3038774 RepID=UPI0024171430|nr:Na/Pi cotransporter family protein [Hydrogenovibrio sp. 3SP14C1]MDG4813558.1 Na/Pi cotransporter family protein [Hydrogenovibrio sp. 3SP14C1]
MKNLKTILLSALIFLLITGWVFAGDDFNDKLDWPKMIMELLGGLALFLFGLDLLIKSLLAVAGEKMKVLLEKLTVNRVTGAISGALVTAVIQSSSVTTVLVVGFVSAGLMTVAQAASVIMGANLGTTITAQIVAFKITNLALLMIAVGFVLQFVGQRSRTRSYGELILGLGLIFFGMNVMSEGMAPLKSYEPFLNLMVEMQNPFYGILTGLIFTALVQSSSATIGIVIVMASNGFLTLPAGIALSMGADIGTCITAVLASIGKSRDAIRSAMIHVGFNILGVLIWLPFISILAYLSVSISPSIMPDIMTMETLAENTPREIANANTIFKLSALLLFLPMIPLFVWAVYKLYPVVEDENNQRDIKPKFLDNSLLSAPSMALDAVEMELEAFHQKFSTFFNHTVQNADSITLDKLTFEDKYTDRLKSYQHEILLYLGKISQSDLDELLQKRHLKLVTVMNILESMIETVDSGIIQAKHLAFENKFKPSETMVNLLGSLAKEVGKSVDNAIISLVESNKDKALLVVSVKSTIDHLIQEALQHQARYLKADNQRIMIFRLEMQIVDALKRMHTLSKRIARFQLTEQEGS